MLPVAKPIREFDASGWTALPLAQAEAEFNALVAAAEPVVLRGYAAHWPLVRAARHSDLAAADYLRYQHGPVRGTPRARVGALLAPQSAQGRFFYNAQFDGYNFSPEWMSFDTLLDTLAQLQPVPDAPAMYVGSTTIDTILPELNAEHTLPLAERDALASIWIGNRTRVAAHHDVPDNLACVAVGRRRFTLFPPEQLANLYIGPLDFTPAGQAISLVDVQAPDLQAFPRFVDAMAAAQVAELAAGDAIFIPSMWWHAIDALHSLNVLINYWWRDTPEHMDSPMNALMLAMMTMRELPPQQRKAWQEMFRHYVFEAGDATAAHIPAAVRHALAPLDQHGARRMRAHLLSKLNR
ncbi:MAG: cupin-like domain-containing protein [Sphingomonadaceae bacterium]